MVTFPLNWLRAGALLALLVPGLALGAGGGSIGGGGGAGGFGTSPARVRTPGEIAEARYNDALKRRDKAWKYEAKAAVASSAKKRAKLETKAQKQYAKAIVDLRKAIEKKPNFYQAHSSLGYALRRTAQYDAALEAYGEALRLRPFYAEAIEYRAETYLALNRLDEVKQAYVRLFGVDRPRADELMQAIKVWLEGKGSNPDGLAPATLSEFASWVRERRAIAQQTARISGEESGRW